MLTIPSWFSILDMIFTYWPSSPKLRQTNRSIIYFFNKLNELHVVISIRITGLDFKGPKKLFLPIGNIQIVSEHSVKIMKGRKET